MLWSNDNMRTFACLAVDKQKFVSLDDGSSRTSQTVKMSWQKQRKPKRLYCDNIWPQETLRPPYSVGSAHVEVVLYCSSGPALLGDVQMGELRTGVFFFLSEPSSLHFREQRAALYTDHLFIASVSQSVNTRLNLFCSTAAFFFFLFFYFFYYSWEASNKSHWPIKTDSPYFYWVIFVFFAALFLNGQIKTPLDHMMIYDLHHCHVFQCFCLRSSTLVFLSVVVPSRLL